ncbi:MAG: sugar-binding domain-containing protein [Mangrovibacterium sp.]
MKRLIILLAFFVTWNAKSQDYSPVKGKLMTEWGERVTPENAWREYPRPQLKRAEWQNLNGLWKYAILPKDEQQVKNFDGNILVPFAVESSLSGVGKSLLPDEKLWYQKKFSIPAGWNGKNIVLHFESVDWESTVWLNGKLVGTHKGGSTAFSFDITKYLKKGEQELLLSVWDPTDTDSQARGKQVLEPKGIWYTAVSGIWKTVWIEPVGKTAIKSVYPVTGTDLKKVTLHTDFTGLKGNEKLEVKVSKDGKTVLTKEFGASQEIVLDIPSPELWSPESPALYQLELSLRGSGKLLDQVGSYFAMRRIAKVKDELGFERIQLNNEPIFQYGTLDQGWWPDGLLTPPSEKAMLYDMEVLKDMGFNMLRKHIKVEPSLYYYYADSLGLLIWQDMVSGFETAKRSAQHVSWDATTDWARPKESAGQIEFEMKETIDQLKFFPSIVSWVIFNEGWGQYETKRVVEWSMDYDSTRIIDGVSGWTDREVGHLNDAHQYPGPGMEPAELNRGRAIVLGEFGGLGLPVENHLWNPNMRNWGYRTYRSEPELIKEYTKLIHNLYPLRYKGLAAAVYTQTTDVEGEVNGLMTYDRKVIKIDPEMLRILHAPLYSTETIRIKNVVQDSQINAQSIRYTKANPGKDWLLGAGASSFSSVQGPLNVEKGESVWSVQSFDLNEVPSGISLKILAFGNVKVYLNGKLVLDKRVIGKRHYEDFNISEFSEYLKKGKNLIAVEASDFENAAPFDYGVYVY